MHLSKQTKPVYGLKPAYFITQFVFSPTTLLFTVVTSLQRIVRLRSEYSAFFLNSKNDRA